MSSAITLAPPTPTAPPQVETAPAPRITRAEQRLAILRELTEIGMELTRELRRSVLEAPPSPEAADDVAPDAAARTAPAPRRDPAESFARLSRAVRLTVALEAKCEDDLDALRAGVPVRAVEIAPAAAAAADPGPNMPISPDHPSAHRNLIRDRVVEVCNREISDIYLAQETLDDLHERLTEGERYDAFVHRPLRETVEAICEDLDLHPDWSAWVDDRWGPPAPGSVYKRWHLMWAPWRERMSPRRRQ